MNSLKTSLKLTLVILICVLASCTPEANRSNVESGWILVYRNDGNGNAVYGDKQKLIDAVRNGLPIRIGFGGRRARDTTKSVEHLADASFLTIANNTEVFAQVSQIIGQRPLLEDDTLKIMFREQNKWTKICGTNGFSTGLMVDYINDSLVNYGRRGQASTSWFVHAGHLDNIPPAQALWD